MDDSASRTVYVSGTIDAEMLAVRREIHRLAAAGGTDPIDLVITSQGGAMVGAFAVVDAITRALDEHNTRTVGIVEGIAASAALTILQGCDHRAVGASALLMAHGASTDLSGDELNVDAKHRFLEIIRERCAELYAARTVHVGGGDAELWGALFKSQLPHYFTPAEALTLGLIDEIIGS